MLNFTLDWYLSISIWLKITDEMLGGNQYYWKLRKIKWLVIKVFVACLLFWM